MKIVLCMYWRCLFLFFGFVGSNLFCFLLSIWVGIGFASLAHPWLGLLGKKSANTWQCLWLILFYVSLGVLYSGRNWLRFARPSQVGAPWQEISKHLAVFVTDLVLCVFVGLFFGRNWLRFARPSLVGVPWQEISNHLRRLSLFCFTCILVNEFPVSL